ncbi:CCNB2 [Mytilus coruscus]|uniref:CCNB2 n=1 Tax=Mytilus coruscus TaxID=42192 RepID=A0A6J8CH85_MYTCO|nr:CCNB2 [Mytilus coruscus]
MALTTRAQSANIMSQTHKMPLNRENPDAALLAKTMAGRPTSHTGQRSALGDIGNKVKAISIDPNRKPAAIKKEIIQPADKLKVLNKNKGTTSLKSLVETVSNNEIQLEQISQFSKLVSSARPPSTSVPECMDISANKEEAFSKALSRVEDIDANDKDNPQLVSEYVNEIYDYMRELEDKYPVKHGYLEGQEITGKMRSILIDWLCQVHHRFHLLQETLYLTVAIIDRFLQEHPVSRNKLQLVGVTSMLIASKYEEMYAPEVADFVYITDNAYTKKEIRDMEGIILRSLDFSVGKPLCLHFLRRNSKAGQVDANKHTLAKYLMELTIIEYDMVQVYPSEIASSALCLANRLLDGSKWNDTLAHYSSYEETELVHTMQKLASLVVKAENSKLTAVKTKYSSSKFMKISTIPELKSQQIKDLAAAAALQNVS